MQERQQVSLSGLPGIVHRHEGDVLHRMELHPGRTETSVLKQSQIGLMGCYGAGSASYRLEICIGNPAYLHSGRKHCSTHTVAAGHILGTSLVDEHSGTAGNLREGDSIEIVTAGRSAYELHAVPYRFFEP